MNLTEFKVQVEKFAKEKFATRILNEPEKEGQFRALEGASAEEKLDNFQEVVERTGAKGLI